MTQDDIDMLLRVAKKLRLPVVGWNDGAECYSSGEGFILEDNSLWNPLRNRAQAFTLMHSCSLRVEPPKYAGFGSSAGNVTVFDKTLSAELRTCRAIVLAADRGNA